MANETPLVGDVRSRAEAGVEVAAVWVAAPLVVVCRWKPSTRRENRLLCACKAELPRIFLSRAMCVLLRARAILGFIRPQHLLEPNRTGFSASPTRSHTVSHSPLRAFMPLCCLAHNRGSVSRRAELRLICINMGLLQSDTFLADVVFRAADHRFLKTAAWFAPMRKRMLR